MKAKLLLAVILTALLNLPSWSQNSTCSSALSISNGSINHNTSNQASNWVMFTASQTNHKLVVWMEIDTIAPDIDSLVVYNGACNSLTPVYTAAFTSSGSMVIPLSGLTVSNTYFIYTKRKPPCQSCPYATRVISYYVETQVSACSDMIGNGGFESHSALPNCGPNWQNVGADYRLFTVGLADRWTTQFGTMVDYFSNNVNGNASSDYLHTTSGNIVCINFIPSPRSGLGHGGIAFRSTPTNGLDYREMIICDDGTLTAIQQGTTYCLTFHYKRVDGTNPFVIGAAFTGSLTTAVTQGGSQLVTGYQTPVANGWVRVDCYMTAQWTGACLFAIKLISATTVPTQNSYLYIDDVSMYETVGISAQSGLTACTNTSMIFQASGATTYNWSVSPSTGINLYPSGATCVAIPNTVGTYTISVSGTTPSGCTTTATNVVTIYATPTLSITPTIGSICSSSGSITFTASPNFSSYSYQWYSQSSGLISGATAYQYTTSTPGTYYVTGTNSDGCVGQSNMVTVNIYSPPTVTLSSTNEHCDGANDGTATATPSGTAPFTYAWTNQAQTTSTITGLDAGTYTVTVTDAHGCTVIGTVIVGTTIVDNPIISTNAVNGNLCNSTTITYTIDDYNPSYTYSASYSVQPISVSNPLTNQYVVTWPSGCNDVTFILSAYNYTPNCTVTASVSLFGCCGACNLPSGNAIMNGSPAHDDLNDFLNDYNPTNSPTGIIYHTGAAPYNWFYNNPNQILYLNGTFNVDPAVAASFTLLSGSIVRMGPNAKILISLNTLPCTLNINQSHVYAGCNVMWDGIYAAGTNKAINVIGTSSQASLMEDSQNGVVSIGGANFTFDHAVFNKCYWSAQASLYSGNHPATIKTTVFTCRNLIFTALQVSALKGTNPSTCQLSQRPIGTYQTAVLLAPYAGRRSYGAVFLNGIGSTTIDPTTLQVTAWTSINIGTGNTTNFTELNIMDNMDFGVYAQNSNAIVLNNHFQNLSGPPAVSHTTPNYGIGVYGTNDALNVSKKIIVGNLSSRNSFYNCNRSIDLNGFYDASIMGNCFLSNIVYSPGSLTQSPYGNYAIFVKSGRYINTEIANNSIINSSIGIAFFSEYLPSGTSYTRMQGTLLIHDNEIKPVVSGLPTTQFVGTAITAQSLTPCGSCTSTQTIWGTPRIENNTAIVDVFNGIDVQGWPENTIVADNVITLRFQPNYLSTVYKQAGVRSISTQGVIIYRNTISGDLATGNTTGKLLLRGIYAISNNAVKVRCNTTTFVGQSIVFDGLNIGPVTNNNMNTATDGLVLMNNGIIGQQGSSNGSGQVCDNKWFGPFGNSHTAVDATSCATNSKLYVRPGYPFTPTVNLGTLACRYNTVGNFTILVLNGSPLSFDCSSAPGIMGDGGDEDGSRIMLMEKTAQDSIAIGDYATEASWTNKQAVYEMLKQDSTLINDSPVLQEFYSETSSGNIGKVTDTGILLTQTNTDSAASVNETINPDLQIEQNYKDLDNIYISLMNGIPSDSIQLQTLEDIAGQCPQQGGLAVYRARVLLNVLYDDIRYWDDNCASSERTGNAEESTNNAPTSEGIDLYPNPNDGNMTLLYNLPAEQQGQFVIYDIMGNTVAKTKLENGLNQKQIDLTQLASGIYYYRVTFGDTIIKNDKIIIVK